jgi:hypothetical protein
MTEEDLKSVLAKYQQKSFELFNQNIVLETQVEQLNKTIISLKQEIDKLTVKTRKTTKQEENFS